MPKQEMEGFSPSNGIGCIRYIYIYTKKKSYSAETRALFNLSDKRYEGIIYMYKTTFAGRKEGMVVLIARCLLAPYHWIKVNKHRLKSRKQMCA